MSEAARLPCPSINRYANINNIIDISEELVQIPICHLERQVAEVQRPRSGPQGPGTAAARILRGYTAALKDLQMHSLDATFGGLNRVKVHVCKPIHKTHTDCQISRFPAENSRNWAHPLLNPRLSVMRSTLSTTPNCCMWFFKSSAVTS